MKKEILPLPKLVHADSSENESVERNSAWYWCDNLIFVGIGAIVLAVLVLNSAADTGYQQLGQTIAIALGGLGLLSILASIFSDNSQERRRRGYHYREWGSEDNAGGEDGGGCGGGCGGCGGCG